MGARRNLYASETNQTYVSLLLEMFSNIIQYQYTGNARLVYAIVRRQEVCTHVFCGRGAGSWPRPGFCFLFFFVSCSFFDVIFCALFFVVVCLFVLVFMCSYCHTAPARCKRLVSDHEKENKEPACMRGSPFTPSLLAYIHVFFLQ